MFLPAERVANHADNLDGKRLRRVPRNTVQTSPFMAGADFIEAHQ